MGSIIVLVLLILVILLAPKIVPYGYADIVKGAQNLGPFQYSEAEQAQIDAGEKLFPHIFGTDELGRDYFIRVVYYWFNIPVFIRSYRKRQQNIQFCNGFGSFLNSI